MGVVVQLSDARDPRRALRRCWRLSRRIWRHVNRIILDRARSNVELIPDLARHLIDSGGKRLRPMLTIAAAKLCGYRGDGHVRLAASVEFMHTATLLHDDVVDESDIRRGKTAARLLWGNEASVLVGDFLLGQAFKMMVDVGSLGCLRILSDAAAVIAEGEVMQLITAKNTETTEDDYLAVIDAKTAALFAAAAEVGAVIANRPKSEAPASAPTAAISASPSSSSTTRSITMASSRCSAKASATISARASSRFPWCSAIAAAIAESAPSGSARFRTAKSARTISPRPWRLMQKHNALSDTMERARHYGAIARDALAIFPEGAPRRRCSTPWRSASTARSSSTSSSAAADRARRDPPIGMRGAECSAATLGLIFGGEQGEAGRAASRELDEAGALEAPSAVEHLADHRRQPHRRRLEVVGARRCIVDQALEASAEIGDRCLRCPGRERARH